MKGYLIEFFAEFAYALQDAECLLCAYDAVMANAQAASLLQAALDAYAADAALDYDVQIHKRAAQIAQHAALHPYTADLLVYICMTRQLRVLYAVRGLDMCIYRDTVLDLKWKLAECRAVKGICGSFVASWFAGFFALKRFALGRLQFEVIPARFDYCKNGICMKQGETPVINVHIPRTGTPMDKESCDRAYAMARTFFAPQVGERAVFVCHSWLLFPQNRQLLPAHTNTHRFLCEYDIVQWDYNKGEDLWRLFDTDEKHPDRLPCNGTLRRCYVEHLKKGGRVGWGAGVKIR